MNFVQPFPSFIYRAIFVSHMGKIKRSFHLSVMRKIFVYFFLHLCECRRKQEKISSRKIFQSEKLFLFFLNPFSWVEKKTCRRRKRSQIKMISCGAFYFQHTTNNRSTMCEKSEKISSRFFYFWTHIGDWIWIVVDDFFSSPTSSSRRRSK